MSVLSRPRALLKYFDRAAQMLSKQMHAVYYYVLISCQAGKLEQSWLCTSHLAGRAGSVHIGSMGDDLCPFSSHGMRAKTLAVHFTH